jgi:hypothetical protein
MKTKLMLSVVATFLLTSTSLNASSIPPKELKAIENADVPIHSYYGFDNPHYKISKKTLAYYKSIGLIPEHQIINKAVKKHSQGLAEAPQEVAQALDLTVDAMDALEKGDTKAATVSLKAATKLFDTAIKNNPKLKLVPVDVAVDVTDHAITLTQAEKIKKDAMQLLQKDRTQEAIDLLMLLRNQITMDTAYLPMEFYPVATKTALQALKSGKSAKTALAILLDGVDTIVHTQITIPVSLLIAQEAIETAQHLTPKDKEKAGKLFDLAKEQLELAHVEGYLADSSAAYKSLMDELAKLTTKVKAGNAVAGDYENSKTGCSALIDSVAKEEASALANPYMIQGNPHAKAKVEEAQLKENFDAKMDRGKFEKEVQKDLKDTVK